MSDLHTFSVRVARQTGVDGSILMNHFAHWHQQNKKAGKNLIDGRYWSYNTARDFADKFPYWSAKQVRTTLLKLERSEWILTAHHGAYDRTTWYALSDTGLILMGLSETPIQGNGDHLPERANGNDQTVKSILPNGQMDLTKRANGNDQTVKSILPNGQMIYKDTITEPITESFTDAVTENAPIEKSESVFSKKKEGITPPVAPAPPVPPPPEPDYITRLRSERIYLEAASKNLKIPPAELPRLLTEFSDECTALNKRHPDYDEFKKHNYNWLRKESEKRQRHATANSPTPNPAAPGSVIRRQYTSVPNKPIRE